MSWKTEIMNIGPKSSNYPKSWIVRGWYEEEKDLYLLVENEWNKLKNNVCATDANDFFINLVTIPIWFLHEDGTWHKKIMNDQEERVGGYDTEEIASNILKNTNNIPSRYVDYEKHLRSSSFPRNLVSHSESVHGI